MAYRGGDDDEGSVGEESLAGQEQPTEDHCMLLIDARPSMLKPDFDGKSPLVASLEAAQSVLRRIVMQGGGGQRNKVGIMIFGAEQEAEEEDDDDDDEGKEETEEGVMASLGGGIGIGGGLGGSTAAGGQVCM